MLSILHHIRKFLLSALKRYSPGRLLQYLLALCRAFFSRSKSKYGGQDSGHEFLPKTLTLAEGKESLSAGGIVTPISGHVISGSCTPKQMEETTAQDVRTSLLCVCNQLLPVVYADHHHLVQGMADLNIRSHRMSLHVNLHTKKAHFSRRPTFWVCLVWCPCSIILDSSRDRL